jgi:cbb3-type cytochrome oxidase cytochrome c subunit
MLASRFSRESLDLFCGKVDMATISQTVQEYNKLAVTYPLNEIIVARDALQASAEIIQQTRSLLVTQCRAQLFNIMRLHDQYCDVLLFTYSERNTAPGE